jgi:hypothetical protein
MYWDCCKEIIASCLKIDISRYLVALQAKAGHSLTVRNRSAGASSELEAPLDSNLTYTPFSSLNT